MKKTKNDSTFPIHAAIIGGSIIAGLFVAGCSPMRPGYQNAPAEMSPVPTVMPSSVPAVQKDIKNNDYATDVKEMDASMGAVPTTGIDGSDIK